ncbi:MAG: SDR family NAD(P)-dependent oxidoreductase [Bacteroidetes bacterium]|nr:SDR family NAD(P)-dependent oxidoreductase [Bacteroidota bacterium]
MKTVLITGANGNLGTEVVKKLYDIGYGVCAAVGPGPLPDNFDEMTKESLVVNLMDEAETHQYVQEITGQHPGICAAVLLVGGYAAGGIKDTDSAAIDKQIALNFKTAYFVVRPLLEHFEKMGGGQFILVGARPALDAHAGKNNVAYSLGKSLVFHLAELINAAGKGKHITATVIVPSTIDTPPNRHAMPDADFSKWIKASDIAENIAFLLTDAGKTLRETVLKVYNEA